ncbi:hypothetical protein [Rhizobium sp. 18065]|uniref:phage fiber-tail adaptor protein n=1 Tax=Rhizobium sp. 18065 TaxID=2681411 RepID=UPI00190F658C|nr:hypothetical protein [Rhizobium sp. 18065]
MSCDVITKAPADRLDYDFDFARWMPSDDRINSATATIAGSTAEVDQVDTSDALARVWISGGALNETGTVTVTIATLIGRTKQVTAKLQIKEN